MAPASMSDGHHIPVFAILSTTLLLSVLPSAVVMTSTAAASGSGIIARFSPAEVNGGYHSSSSSSGSEQHQHYFYHLAVDPPSGNVYIGARNRLHQLDSNLRPVKSVTTGPQPDNPRCTESFAADRCGAGGTASFDVASTDNVNKILVVDVGGRRLVTCGSVFQGTCQLRSLADIEEFEETDARGNTDYFVAANDPDLSTVAFVAPGPSRSAGSILYVAATYTGTPATAAVRQAVPAVSGRTLGGQNPFRFAHVDGLTGGTMVRLRSEAVEKFIVDYVAGFSAAGFSYFVTNQRDKFELANSGVPPTVSGEVTSRIIQICQNDRNFYSYVEMPLRCRSSSTGVDYPVIRAAVLVDRPGSELARQLGAGSDEQLVVAAFAGAERRPSGGERDAEGPAAAVGVESAVCVYRLSDVRSRFMQNVQRCFSGEQKFVGLQFNNRMCVSLGIIINQTYCGEVEQNGPLVGTVAMDAVPVLVLPETELTAVAVSTVEQHTVAFLGTADGHIKKVTLRGDGSSSVYEDFTVVNGSPINKDLQFSRNRTELYVLTSQQVTKLSVSQCEQYASCETCRSAGDPYCGWCSLERRCSTKASCLDSYIDKRWLASSAWECIRIPPQFVNPVNIGIRKSIQVSVGIKALPVLGDGDKYMCVFGSNWTVTIGVVSPNEIKCQTPTPTLFAQVFHSHSRDHVNLTLSIRSSQTGVDFLDTLLSFYDCSRHTSCSACTQSSWGCSWCIQRSQCLQAEDMSTCRAVIVEEPEFCPRLRHVPGSQLLIPAGVSRELQLTAAYLPATKNSDRGYDCLVHLTSPPIQVQAKRESATSILCEPFVYWYEADEPQKTVSLEVVLNGRYLLDDSYGTTVTVFKCDVMAPDCSTCHSLQMTPLSAKYGCQWCSDQCRHNSSCDSTLPAVARCPLPVIETVHPLTGLMEGGIRVTIHGSNLGTNFDQVRSSVTVAGVPCEVLASDYVISRQIVCKTGPMAAHKVGPVIVVIGDAVITVETPFRYQSPHVYQMSPKIGPRAGGTEVSIQGHDLDTSSAVQILFDYVPCHVNQQMSNGSLIICTTTSVSTPVVLPVAMRFDEAVLRLDDQFEFVYAENPTIVNIRPLSAFRSGGRVITVHGAYLNTVQQPVMHLFNRVHKFSSPCSVVSGSLLHCPSPHIVSHLRRSTFSSRDYSIGFKMDGVDAVRDLQVYYPSVRSVISVHQDPAYDYFKNGKRIYKGEALILTGQNLNTACDASEIIVWIGNSTCKVNSLDTTTLYCTPPVSQPFGLSTAGQPDHSVLPVVKVVIGNLAFVLGQLEYQKLEPARSEYWIVGVAICGGTMLTIIFVILIVYKRKSTYAERQFKRLQLQLDSLESNIRNECKQAFAELQTEVSDFTSDLGVVGIPFWDYQAYAYKVFFPSLDDADEILQSGLKTSSCDSAQCNTAVNQFYQLLNVDCFLLNFIRTLDAQPNFSIKDKSKIASLIIAVFHDRMNYITGILKVLLGELVDRSVERKQPKLMLRRTEYIVEKLLTNWLSLCMHGYLKRNAARPMFMLYKAIKHQTEKGPVDAVTFEARYALSEDRLLREKIESKPLTVYIVSDSANQDPVVCKMLDCDTISQAKEKALDAVFRNTPFSQRPSIHNVELEFMSSCGRRLLLRDSDASTATIGRNERRLNTLSHYRIPDGATVAIVARYSTTFRNNGFGNGITDTLRRVSELTSKTTSNAKFFHLVTHDDGQHFGRDQKVMSEIFLTRLLATKCTLQQYVDDLFTTILRVDNALPPAVKYLFDIFDIAARHHGIMDPEVVHTWKSNSLLLRFWVNMIKNPEFVFDVHKSPIVDSCLSVIAQIFMDSCSMQEQRLGKDSPSSKLLYAKDIPRYRQMVAQFYKGVQDMPPISDQQMDSFMLQHSETNRIDFRVLSAVSELLKFAKQYKFELLELLDDDSTGRRLHLANRLEEMLSAAEDAPAC